MLKVGYALLGVIVGTLGLISELRATDTVSFPDVWASLSQSAPLIQIASTNLGRYDALVKADSHGLDPRFSITGHSIASDSGAGQLMSLIGQRSLSNSDLSTSYLNSPGVHTQNRLGIGFEWPIFDSGIAGIGVSLRQLDREGAAVLQTEVVRKTYAALGRSYWSWSNAIWLNTQLSALEAKLDSAMKSYQFRDPSNPMGYSGWAAYKLVKAELNARRRQAEMTQSTAMSHIQGIGYDRQDWKPSSMNINDDLARYFATPNVPTMSTEERMNLIQASQTTLKETQISRRDHPQISVIGGHDVVAGERALAGAFVVGAAMQWTLPTDSQDRHAVLAADRHVLDLNRQHLLRARESEIRQLKAQSESLRTTAAAVQDAIYWAKIQSDTMSNLYRNGVAPAAEWIGTVKNLMDGYSRLFELNQQQVSTQIDLFLVSSGTPKEN